MFFFKFIGSCWSICPDEFVPMNGICVLIQDETKIPWYEAEWFCRNKNALLVQPKNNLLLEQLIELLSYERITRNYWIGGHYVKNKWFWVDKSPINTKNIILPSNE